MTENRKIYQEPEMEVIVFTEMEVITTSGGGTTPGFDIDEGEGW